jgi:hypothetical protein
LRSSWASCAARSTGPESLALVEELSRIPGKIEEILRSAIAQCEQLAKEFSNARDFLYLGRGIHFPIALEGALKLKEISYIHAEGYPAGEMKHGPNALIDETLPVVVLAPSDESDPASKLRYEKTLSNIQEVTARSGRVIAIATEGDTTIGSWWSTSSMFRRRRSCCSPLIEIVPLQLLAYYIAVRRGCDVDQPRNLAKSVTVDYALKNVRQVPSTLSIANFLADPGYVQQIFITSEPFFAEQAGADVRTLPISSSGYDPYRVAFTSRDFATQHPDLVAKFVRASIRGWQAYLADPTATNAALLKLNPALNPAQEAYSAQALRDGGFITGAVPANPQTGRMTAARWQTLYEQLKSLGILHNPIDPTTAYALNFAQ